ncbi:MAG: NADPH:quinone reductase, partial [Chloroflexi bacterium]|nr:NADPH:quinone reductase [Chloroflexota bacterium]
MRAAWYERQGEASNVLTVGEMEAPTAGPGEIRVRVACSGVNPSDVKRRGGWRGQKVDFARVVPHSDGSGVVDQVGEGVDPRRVGQRVWVYNGQWKRPFGTCAELICLPEQYVVRLPDNTDFAAGASLGIPGLTAHRCVFADGPVGGQTVLVTGGAGSVGFYAIELAKWGGANVIATVSSDEKASVARKAGADEVVNYRAEDVGARVMALTDGQGVDRVVEVDFGANLPATSAVLKPHGIVATYASMTQPDPTINFYGFMSRNALFRLVFVYEVPPAALAKGCADLNACLEDGAMRHHIAARF